MNNIKYLNHIITVVFEDY